MDAPLRQSKLRPTGLLDLPNELLTEIASLVDHELIQALRLVCRRLDPIASSFLTFTILVKQTQESLDDVQRLLERPHVASGVRGITVTLAHRFSPLVQDESLFTQVFEKCMLYRHFPCHNIRRPSESASECMLRTLQETRQSFIWRSEHKDGEHGWQEEWPHLQIDKTRPNDTKEKYERLIRSTHEMYETEYHEASRIASERSLILALVKLVCFIKHPVTLKYETVFDRYPRKGAPGPETMILYFMSDIPCLFSLQEQHRKPVENDMVLQDAIIWDLPISLHQAGCILHTFVLDNVLKIMGDAVLFADFLSPSNKRLDQFQEALQNLTELDIKGMMHMNMDLGATPDINHVREPPAKRLMLEDLLRMCLSGPGLHTVKLDANSKLNWATWADRATWIDPPRHTAGSHNLTPMAVYSWLDHKKYVSVSYVPLKRPDGTVSGLLGWSRTDYTFDSKIADGGVVGAGST